jgi:hypothetical protein
MQYRYCRVFSSVSSNCVFCPVLFADSDVNTLFLAQSGLCFQRGADHSVPFPQENSILILLFGKKALMQIGVWYRYLFYLYFRADLVFVSRWIQILIPFYLFQNFVTVFASGARHESEFT